MGWMCWGVSEFFIKMGRPAGREHDRCRNISCRYVHAARTYVDMYKWTVCWVNFRFDSFLCSLVISLSYRLHVSPWYRTNSIASWCFLLYVMINIAHDYHISFLLFQMIRFHFILFYFISFRTTFFASFHFFSFFFISLFQVILSGSGGTLQCVDWWSKQPSWANTFTSTDHSGGTYGHTYVHAYMQSYMHTHTHTYAHTYAHNYCTYLRICHLFYQIRLSDYLVLLWHFRNVFFPTKISALQLTYLVLPCKVQDFNSFVTHFTSTIFLFYPFRSHMCAVDGQSNFLKCPDSCDADVPFEECTCRVDAIVNGTCVYVYVYVFCICTCDLCFWFLKKCLCMCVCVFFLWRVFFSLWCCGGIDFNTCMLYNFAHFCWPFLDSSYLPYFVLSPLFVYLL